MEVGPSSFDNYGGGGGRGDRGGRGGFGDRGGRGGGHSYQKMHSEQIGGGGQSFQQKSRGDGTTIYVGNLNINTDRDALQSAFQNQNCDVRKVNILQNDQGKSKGAGFVTFGSAEEAQSVVETCQRSGMTVDGNRLIVQLARQ